MKNIPKKIWLNLGLKDKVGGDFRDLKEVSWSEDEIDDGDIEYVRRDLVLQYGLEQLEEILKFIGIK